MKTPSQQNVARVYRAFLVTLKYINDNIYLAKLKNSALPKG